MTYYIQPPDGAPTAYVVSRQRLHIKKAKQLRIKKLCNLTGMALEGAKRQCEAEWADGSLQWVEEVMNTLPQYS